MSDLVRRAAALVVEAKRAVVLTGAGISTPSGIPDFRSPGTGLWEKIEPEAVASLSGFLRDPAAFCSWLRPLLSQIVYAEPNPAHRALAALERAGLVRIIITQNIDGLHQKAGSRQVLELHGNLRQATCLRCHHQMPAAGLIEGLLASAAVPRCPECGGIIKPDVVLYGELLPVDVLTRAEEEATACDLMWVVGSSLAVAPASFLPQYAAAHGASLLITNREPTPLDSLADLVLRDDVAELLPAIADACQALLEAGRRPRS
ncbi:MAG: NAD-dependent deacylase [Anaerolineae bacterium]|nr:NAD-dependent deacylase [Anaerolineae bacterium]